MRILGVMSGTSVDAIDLALVTITPRGDEIDLTVDAYGERPWPAELRTRLLAVGAGSNPGSEKGHSTSPDSNPGRDGETGPALWCRLHADTGRAFGDACAWALHTWGPADLIVLHGQTLHHLVEDGQVLGSLQIGSPAHVHAATGVPVLSDLRSADIAAGGQGAPLASTFDALWLGDTPTAVLNLGGIANITLVGGPDGVVTGDTGPANCLLDAAATRDGATCDHEGRRAAAGHVDQAALTRLLSDPFYARALPRSTGREHFHADYVPDLLAGHPLHGPDLYATLTELTARTVVDTVRAATGATAPDLGVTRIVASGGGTANPVLMSRLRDLAGVPVLPSDDLGLPSCAKEACLMALLGWLSAHGLPGVVTGRHGPVTGARRAAVLGTLTPPFPPAPTDLDHDHTAPCRPPRRLQVRVPDHPEEMP